MKFRQFIIAAADHIGRQYVPVRDAAHAIDEFIGPDSVHDDLAPRVVRAIYKANRCGHLDAHVSPEATFDALGKFHGELLRNQRTDLEQIRFVQALGELASDLLSTDPQRAGTPDVSRQTPRDSSDANNDNDNDNDVSAPSTSGQRGVVQFQRQP